MKGFTFDKNDDLEQVASILGFKYVEDEEEADIVVLSQQKYKTLGGASKSKASVLYKQEKWLLKLLGEGKLDSELEELLLLKSKEEKNALHFQQEGNSEKKKSKQLKTGLA